MVQPLHPSLISKLMPALRLAVIGLLCLMAHPMAAHASGGGGGDGGHKSSGGDGESEKKGGGKEAQAGDLLYVRLEPMVLPVITDNGAQQLITLLIQLQVKDFAAQERLQMRMPQLTDAIFTALYGGLGQGSLRQGHLVNIAKVKRRIIEAVDKAIAPNLIDEVLIGGVGQRML